MDKSLKLKLNAGRTVSGILRGFDPFMNVVLDDTIEECRDGTKNNVGMVVSANYKQLAYIFSIVFQYFFVKLLFFR